MVRRVMHESMTTEALAAGVNRWRRQLAALAPYFELKCSEPQAQTKLRSAFTLKFPMDPLDRSAPCQHVLFHARMMACRWLGPWRRGVNVERARQRRERIDRTGSASSCELWRGPYERAAETARRILAASVTNTAFRHHRSRKGRSRCEVMLHRARRVQSRLLAARSKAAAHSPHRAKFVQHCSRGAREPLVRPQ